MSQEKEKPIYHNNFTLLMNKIQGVSRDISKISQIKTAYPLTWEQKEQLLALNIQKGEALVEILKMRKEGERKIKVTLKGNPEDLHPYSHHSFLFSLTTPSNNQFITGANLANLRQVDKSLDVLGLIGQFDEVDDQESSEESLWRLIQETRSVNHALKDARRQKNGEEIVRLRNLKISLIAKILEIRKNGQIKGKIKLGHLSSPINPQRFDLIEVKIYSRKPKGPPYEEEGRFVFHLPFSFFPLPPEEFDYKRQRRKKKS